MTMWLKKHIYFICCMTAAVILGMPVFIYILNEYVLVGFLTAGLTAGDLLAYFGGVAAFFATVALGVLAFYQNEQLKELNEHESNTNDKLMEIEKMGMRVYTALESKESTIKNISNIVGPGIFNEGTKVVKFRLKSKNENFITEAKLEQSFMAYGIGEGWHDLRGREEAANHIFLEHILPLVEIIDNNILEINYPLIKNFIPYESADYTINFKLSVVSMYGERTTQYYDIHFKSNKIDKWNTRVEPENHSFYFLILDLYELWINKNNNFQVSLYEKDCETEWDFKTINHDFAGFLRHIKFDSIRVVNKAKEKIVIYEPQFESYLIKRSELVIKLITLETFKVKL